MKTVIALLLSASTAALVGSARLTEPRSASRSRKRLRMKPSLLGRASGTTGRRGESCSDTRLSARAAIHRRGLDLGTTSEDSHMAERLSTASRLIEMLLHGVTERRGRLRRQMADAIDDHRMTPEDDPSWRHYADTILEVFADRSLVLDLTTVVPLGALGRLDEQGVGPTFAVLTASNPYGRVMDDLWNPRLTQALRIEVATGGRAWVPADGVSRDGTHREVGVAASMPKADARLLASKFGQSAFFWFDGVSMWIVGAGVDSPDIKLPLRPSGPKAAGGQFERRLSG